MLVATAGHIDHGKTSLVGALTGVETDRLPEERERGISIDLGFAYWTPEGGRTIGFVDVPGHERFVRNMLAGVAAVDFALLVVAADDGVMPQSLEHVQILDLLGIASGIVAITKIDRVEADRVASVRDQVRSLLEHTTLAGAAIFEVSSVTGSGVPELADVLRAASRSENKRPAEGRHLRFAIDRAFTMSGVGTIVTGTVLDGVVEAGARLVLSPRGREVRVRGIQSAGKPVASVRAGQRCALSLAGVEVAQVHRGDWLVVQEMHGPTSRIEAQLKLLPGLGEQLKHNATVHLHLGTADFAARVLIPRQTPISPGSEAVAQLVLEHSTCAVTGDRFVLRDQSSRHTIGGGRVINPFAVAGDRRRLAMRMAVSASLQSFDARQALAGLLAIPGYQVDTQNFERCFNLETPAAEELYRQSDAVVLGRAHKWALPVARVAAISQQILDLLAAFHRANPLEQGMSVRALEAEISTTISNEAMQAIQRIMIEAGQIESGGSFVKLAGHKAAVNNADVELWRKLLRAAEERGEAPFTAREIAGDLGVADAAIGALLVRMRGTGDVWRITDERFMLNQRVAMLAAKASALAEEVGAIGFSAAQYRDVIGTGRGLAIQILEFFDTVGVTRRSGDRRKVQPEYERILRRAVQLERGRPAVAYAQKQAKRRP